MLIGCLIASISSFFVTLFAQHSIWYYVAGRFVMLEWDRKNKFSTLFCGRQYSIFLIEQIGILFFGNIKQKLIVFLSKKLDLSFVSKTDFRVELCREYRPGVPGALNRRNPFAPLILYFLTKFFANISGQKTETTDRFLGEVTFRANWKTENFRLEF